MRTARRLLAVAILAAAGYVAYRFVRSNGGEVPVDLVAAQLGPAPLWLVLAAAFGAGLGLGALLLLYPAVRQALTARRYRKAVASLERELHELRSLPLAEEEPAAGGASPPRRAGRRAARGSG